MNCFGDNIDEPRGHDAEWNKPDPEGQMLYDLTWLWSSQKSQKQGVGCGCHSVEGGANREVTVKGNDIFALQDL